ncbi:MAG: four helix bundle protein [Candidatus Levybacteria bacterium CG10_big_fil_rev_8_21_14_0_10_35_13]|nr:MAG: four helix bundle protein [Candidatus Levybacteria bacterium CG10_big_fil_rev_8_21_14_0_10_35_13]
MDRRIGSEKDIILIKADKLAKEIYRITKTFPKEELFGITSQLRRAALSIPLNLVEGYARISKQDHRRFLEIALGSTKETKYLIYFSYEQKLIKESDKEDLLDLSEEISKLLWVKIKTLRLGGK